MRIKLLIEQVGSTVRNGLFSPLGWLAACFLREYLCEMTERKKTGCLGDGCQRQLGMLHQLLLGIGDAQLDNPFSERHVINGFDIRREVGAVGCQRGCHFLDGESLLPVSFGGHPFFQLLLDFGMISRWLFRFGIIKLRIRFRSNLLF